MNISVEISMYPLSEDYTQHIDRFLEILHQTEGLEVRTNVMSTQVFGPMDKVFAVLQSAVYEAYQELDQCPFVFKLLKKDVSANPIKDYKA